MAYGFSGDVPPEMMRFLEEKYRQSGQLAASQSAQNYAQAGLQTQQAQQVAPLAASQIGMEGARAGLDRAQTKEVAPNAASERFRNDSAALRDIETTRFIAPLANMSMMRDQSTIDTESLARKYYPALTTSEIGLRSAQGRALDAEAGYNTQQTKNAGMVLKSPGGLLNMERPAALRGFSNILDGIFGYQKGTARVPGKGSGDKVPAMLEPGEAVLNKHAAGMIGREKIAAANKKGNEKRAKETQGKVADLIKMLGMA